MRFITAALAGCLLALPVTWATADTKTPAKNEADKLVCAKNDDVEKIMEDKGYSLLLNMTRKEDNKEGIIESLWVGGQSAVVTASVPNTDTSCLLANMDNVIINPNAIESIWEAYKKQNKQKDI